MNESSSVSQSLSLSLSQSIVTKFREMRKLLYDRDFDKYTSPDSVPLIRRSKKTNKQDSTFGAIEKGDTKKCLNRNDNNGMASSSFHLLNDDDDGSASGARDDSIIVSTTSTSSSNEDNTGRNDYSRSSSSWILFQKGRIILLILAIVYGSLNISMRLVFSRPDPPTASASSTIQGWFAVVCFLPLLWRNHAFTKGWLGMPPPFGKGHLPTNSKLGSNSSSSNSNNNNNPRSFWRFALELASFNFGTQALINMSLVSTQGARASFLVQMSVVFTPVLSVLFGQQKVSKRVWIACFVALVGLFVLSYSEEEQDDNTNNNSSVNHSSRSVSLKFTWGDWCCLLAALCWSLYIYRLSAWGEFFDETITQFVKNIVLAVLYTLWMIISFASRYYYNFNYQENENDHQSTTDDNASKSVNLSLWTGWRNDPIAWWILFYSALGPCTLADVFQQKAQSTVPAAETNVILSLEPVFTTLLGFLLLGETPSLQELCGGLLIMIASAVASCGPQSSTAASR
jgi:drug/metabolite transporter (DMT)-like permease